MPIDEKAFQAFTAAYHEYGGTGLGFRKCLVAYESAKAPKQPSKVSVGGYSFPISAIEKPYYTKPEQSEQPLSDAPGTDQPVDCRAAFERWMLKDSDLDSIRWSGDRYEFECVNDMYEGWKGAIGEGMCTQSLSQPEDRRLATRGAEVSDKELPASPDRPYLVVPPAMVELAKERYGASCDIIESKLIPTECEEAFNEWASTTDCRTGYKNGNVISHGIQREAFEAGWGARDNKRESQYRYLLPVLDADCKNVIGYIETNHHIVGVIDNPEYNEIEGEKP